VRAAFAQLSAGNAQASAVRSSASAEDLPDASFAGQQETFLNVVGIEDVLHKMKEVFASLYNDRAISYRVHKGFAHDVVALSAGVQRMVRSDLGGRRDVHHRHRERASRTCSSPAATAWARPWCRAP
jgi:pyruvate,water dikinase